MLYFMHMLGFSFVYIDYCRININRSSYNNCNIQDIIVYNNYMYILVIKGRLCRNYSATDLDFPFTPATSTQMQSINHLTT